MVAIGKKTQKVYQAAAVSILRLIQIQNHNLFGKFLRKMEIMFEILYTDLSTNV